MKTIKILGTGCPKCEKLAEMVSKVAQDLSIEVSIEKIKEMNTIITYGVMMTPGLVIDDKVVTSGKIPSYEEIKNFLR